ncbi:hypothetical protein EV207_1029 [Scopulibacillus darangshiensis]|uniref:Uncharacterized protein n=1 Tax=Scopulibacillus darangshiensis TaxID=442528 RepID=A0A4R2P9D2_9BACL|nr:hypothetical protein [Scopulibacillus darangshiensis]TCP31522.1 hypothetical protein EV207_1029 [Scopulibacillus darangshiensis]
MNGYNIPYHSNVWFILITIVVMYTLQLLLPKRFALFQSVLFTLAGITFVIIFDNTICVPPFDYYDINKYSSFELMDFLAYAMYGPISYLYIYFYDKFQVKGYYNLIYILLWTVLAILAEYVAVVMGVYHYKHGYTILFSIPVYLFVQSLNTVLYHVVVSSRK